MNNDFKLKVATTYIMFFAIVSIVAGIHLDSKKERPVNDESLPTVFPKKLKYSEYGNFNEKEGVFTLLVYNQCGKVNQYANASFIFSIYDKKSGETLCAVKISKEGDFIEGVCSEVLNIKRLATGIYQIKGIPEKSRILATVGNMESCNE